MNRKLKQILSKRINQDRACALIGPRQVGKSYLMNEIIQELGGVYLTLDDPIVRDEIKKDPLVFLKNHYNPDQYLFIDEPAKAPSLFDAIKILIDEAGSKNSKICIANSGNYLLLRRVKESLAGRISILSMLPFSWSEISTCSAHYGLFQILNNDEFVIPKKIDYIQINRTREQMLLWGGYPIPALASDNQSKIRWIRDYLATYVFPIIIEQFQIRNLDAFEKFVRLIFINSAQLLNRNRLASAVGVSQPTIENFLYQLKAMMLVQTLEVYHRNPRKRLVKQNKIHVIDPLLLHSALNTNFSIERAKELGCFGIIYESFICIELYKIFYNTDTIFDAYYWRTHDGAEVDLVIECQGQVIPFEIKASENISSRDTTGLMSFLDDNTIARKGYIIYPGRDIIQVNSKIAAIPDWWLLGCFAQ